MVGAEGFRPFFFPEFGYVAIALGLAAMVSMLRGGGRGLRARLKNGAPIRTILTVGLVACSGGVVMGFGLVLESRSLVWLGGGLFVPAALVFGVLGWRYDRTRTEDIAKWGDED